MFSRFAGLVVAFGLACAGMAACAVSRADDTRPIATDSATGAVPAGSANAAADIGEPHLGNSELGRAIALTKSDPKKAADTLHGLQAKMPWLGDVLEYYSATARARFDHGGARHGFETFLATHGDSVLLPDAAVELARLVESEGDVEHATVLADHYGRSGSDSSQAAGVCLCAGRLLAPRDASRAYLYLQCARTKSPMSSAAASAYDLVQSLRRDHAELRPADAAAMLAEARLLGREGRSAEEAAMLRDLLAKFPASASQPEAELVYGRILGRSESKAAGAAFFEERAKSASGAHKAKLLYEAATLRWNNDQNAEATALFNEMLAMKSGIGDEQQALYALARIADAENRRGEAISYFGRAAAAARGPVRAESQWRQCWVSYKAKDFEAAERAFAAMAASAPRGSDTDGRPEALYWQGRCLEKLSRQDQARQVFTTVLDEFPLGYYAAAAEHRLGRSSAGTMVAPQPVPPATLPAAASLAIRRATALRQAGLVALAARDLDDRVTHFDAPTLHAVLPALPAAGAYDMAFRVAVSMNDKGQLSHEDARAYLYPKAHADIVESEAKKAGIDPMLVYALMRQESAFATTAVSSAKALGLMQLLVTTARRVAAQSGLPAPEPEELFDPVENIRLGVRYLAELSKLFHGDTALVAAAYNAGEQAAQKWQELATKFDEDEMIEQITYRETRQYVKSVLRNMRNYRSIYGTTTVAKNG